MRRFYAYNESNNNDYYNGDYYDPTAYWVKDNVFYTLRVFGDDTNKEEIQATLERILREIWAKLLNFPLRSAIMSLSAWQHSDNKNLDSPYFTDNLNTPDNMSKNTHTKLFKLQFSGASGNNKI